MATQVAMPSDASQQKPTVDLAVVDLAQQLSKLRADIVAGRHSRFKVPEHIARSIPSTGGESTANVSGYLSRNGPNSKAAAFNSIPAAYIINPPPQHAPQSDPLRASSSSIDPRAVLQQKRQELEHVLEEQIQHKKLMTRQKTCDQEIVAEFDVAEVLRKAHELVKPWEPSETAANRDASSSDSFDENTFYSSQMNESTTTEEVETAKNWRRPLRACRFFRDGKPCPYGEKCTFSHDPAVVRKIEVEEHERVAVNQARTNEKATRRASPPRKAPTASNGAIDSAPDPQSARIAELEEQLRQMKEQQRPKTTVVPRAIERPDPEPLNQVDEFGRDRSKRESYREEPKDIVRDPSPSIYSGITEVDHDLSNTQHPVQVVRNHITSPYAPQAARISPLTGIKPPQILRIQRVDESGLTNAAGADAGNTRQSPASIPQPVSNRKRKRIAQIEDTSRNIAPRTENMVSPDVRIKEEPVSPPPYNSMTRVQQIREPAAFVHSASSSRSQDQVIQNGDDGRYVFQAPIPERRPLTPTRRVISNGQQYLGHEDTDLRRVVSTRNLRAMPSPGYDTPYSDPQPRFMRATSQTQYVTAPEQQPAIQYRASVQPAFRERPSPRQIELTPDRPPPIAMPPPKGRIVVDQFGNRYMEAPAPMPAERPVSVARQIRYEPHYEQIPPSGHPTRRTQPISYQDEGRYVQEVATPTSPQYVDYPTSSRKRQVIHFDQNNYDQVQEDDPQLVRYEARAVARYQDMNGIGDDQVRMERMTQMDDQMGSSRRETTSRMSSVRPKPRLVRFGEHEDTSPRVMRQVSVRPEDEYARPVQRMQGEPMYQYAPQEMEQNHYAEASQQNTGYEQPRSGSRRIVRV